MKFVDDDDDDDGCTMGGGHRRRGGAINCHIHPQDEWERPDIVRQGNIVHMNHSVRTMSRWTAKILKATSLLRPRIEFVFCLRHQTSGI